MDALCSITKYVITGANMQLLLWKRLGNSDLLPAGMIFGVVALLWGCSKNIVDKRGPKTWTSLKYAKTRKFGKMPGLRFSYFLRLPETCYIHTTCVFAQINVVFYSNRYIIVYTDLFVLIDIVWIVTMPLTSSSFCRSSLSVSDILFSKCGPESLFSLLWTRENKIMRLLAELGCVDYVRSMARSINKIERGKWNAGCLGWIGSDLNIPNERMPAFK